jgi:hypothetical protein
MSEKIARKKFWELYHKLPVELQDALFSTEMGEEIVEICDRYNADLDIALDGFTEVLLGILPPDQYLDRLGKSLNNDPDAVRRFVHEINRFVLFPVKDALEEVYNLEMTPLAGSPSPNASKKSVYQEPIG